MKTYDSGLEREALAAELAEWKAAGVTTSFRATRWHRRTRRLAKRIGTTVESLIADLNADANAILAIHE